MISTLFLGWLAAMVCFLAALERPDRQRFWLLGSYACGAMTVLTGLTGVA